MPWWAWLTVGAILLIAEVTVVDLEFYLVFLGISAFAVGLADLAGVEAPYWAQWLSFAALAFASLVFFRGRVYEKLRPPPEGEVPEGIQDETATAIDDIEPGAVGAVALRGTRWNGRNDGSRRIVAGTPCDVERSDSTVLRLIPRD